MRTVRRLIALSLVLPPAAFILVFILFVLWRSIPADILVRVTNNGSAEMRGTQLVFQGGTRWTPHEVTVDFGNLHGGAARVCMIHPNVHSKLFLRYSTPEGSVHTALDVYLDVPDPRDVDVSISPDGIKSREGWIPGSDPSSKSCATNERRGD